MSGVGIMALYGKVARKPGPILKIFEDSIQNLDGNINIKKRVYIIMVELLENISEHAVEFHIDNQELKEGIL